MILLFIIILITMASQFMIFAQVENNKSSSESEKDDANT